MDLNHYSTYRTIVLPVREIPGPLRHPFGQSQHTTFVALLTHTRLYVKTYISPLLIIEMHASFLTFLSSTKKNFLAFTCTFLRAFSRYRALFACPRSVPRFLCYRVLFCLCRWALHPLVQYIHGRLRHLFEYITLDRHWPKPQPNLVPPLSSNSPDPPELARPA